MWISIRYTVENIMLSSIDILQKILVLDILWKILCGLVLDILWKILCGLVLDILWKIIC